MEIGRCQAWPADAAELELELGRGIVVGAGLDDRVDARGEPADLARMVGGEGGVADPVERPVAGAGRIGVDAGKVDLVLAVAEIGDHVAYRAACPAVVD